MAEYALHQHRKCLVVGLIFVKGVRCSIVEYLDSDNDDWHYVPVDELTFLTPKAKNPTGQQIGNVTFLSPREPDQTQ